MGKWHLQPAPSKEMHPSEPEVVLRTANVPVQLLTAGVTSGGLSSSPKHKSQPLTA